MIKVYSIQNENGYVQLITYGEVLSMYRFYNSETKLQEMSKQKVL